MFERLKMDFEERVVLPDTIMAYRRWSWKHVPSQGKPADLLFRGIMPRLLDKLHIW